MASKGLAAVVLFGLIFGFEAFAVEGKKRVLSKEEAAALQKQMGSQIMQAQGVQKSNERGKLLDETTRIRGELADLDAEIKKNALKNPHAVPGLIEKKKTLEEALRKNGEALRAMDAASPAPAGAAKKTSK